MVSFQVLKKQLLPKLMKVFYNTVLRLSRMMRITLSLYGPLRATRKVNAHTDYLCLGYLLFCKQRTLISPRRTWVHERSLLAGHKLTSLRVFHIDFSVRDGRHFFNFRYLVTRRTKLSSLANKHGCNMDVVTNR